MVSLAQSVPAPFTSSPQLGVGADQLVSGVDDLRASDLRFQALQSRAAPPTEDGPVADLCDRLERDEGRPADKKRFVLLGER